VLLILAWKNAGYIGLDYFLLPMLGTPWRQKVVAAQATPTQPTPAVATR
jgi:thiosulfate dehydrogenase (quinone) large subunit